MNAHKKRLSTEQISRINAAIAESGGVHTAESITSDIERLPNYHRNKGWKNGDNEITRIVGHPCWIDHTEIQKTEDGAVFVANPYHLFVEDFEDFEKLRGLGYGIAVRGDSDYSPTALQITITPPSVVRAGYQRHYPWLSEDELSEEIARIYS